MKPSLVAITILAALLAPAPRAQPPCGWSALGTGTSATVNALAVFDDGSGPALYAGGSFISASGIIVNRVAKWDGTIWLPLASGVSGPVYSMAAFGSHLYVGGNFSMASGTAATNIARWDGSSWSDVGGGTGAYVEALEVLDDGNGADLYAGGFFASMGGTVVNHVARWDGSAWSALGSGLNGNVWALGVYNDGTGPAIYAGGAFSLAIGTGIPVNRVARWGGAIWQDVGGGTSDRVLAFQDFNDGSGPALYAGGAFSYAGTNPASRIARWNGVAWSEVGGGMDANVNDLVVFDDGNGPALYAAGLFTTAGGQPASRVARWNGLTWMPLGAGLGAVSSPSGNALAVHDGGNGPDLYAGGGFSFAGSVNASGVACWAAPGPLTLIMGQAGGPGGPVSISNGGLFPGGAYRNFLSLDPCPGAPGSGPYLGLCAADPSFIIWQVSLPLGTPIFHFTTSTCAVVWGPYLLPPVTLDGLCVDVSGGAITAISGVTRLVVQ